MFEAANATDLYIVDGGRYNGYAIVWMTGDTVFLAKYDARSNSIGSEMAATKIDKDDPLKWRRTMISNVTDIQSVRYEFPKYWRK